MLYTTDRKQQDAYIASAIRRGYDVLLMDNVIDAHFINALEYKLEKVHFVRVDADTLDKLIDKGLNNEAVLSEDERTKLKEVFEQVLDSKSLTVSVEAQPTDELPVTITMPEFMRRMKDMSVLSGEQSFYGNLPNSYNVVVNANHPLIGKILAETDADAQKTLVKQTYDLALLAQNMLTGADLTAFVHRTVAAL
jgi:molecular chaperone HtpG